MLCRSDDGVDEILDEEIIDDEDIEYSKNISDDEDYFGGKMHNQVKRSCICCCFFPGKRKKWAAGTLFAH